MTDKMSEPMKQLSAADPLVREMLQQVEQAAKKCGLTIGYSTVAEKKADGKP